MASAAFSQGNFIVPKVSLGPETQKQNQKLSGRRFPSVYDAVAGRVSAAGFIPKESVFPSTRDTTSYSTAALSPEAVLFRTRQAPTRYAEADIYYSNERSNVTDLPQSDLLKAVHCYSSDFYSRTTVDRGTGDWKSMDETALLAFGMLMEEAARDILGESGDLVFTEGEPIDQQVKPSPCQTSPEGRPSKKRRVVSD